MAFPHALTLALAGFNVFVQADGVQRSAGDGLAAVKDGLHRCTPDEVRQAADHPCAAFMQVGIELEQMAFLVAPQTKRVLQGGNKRFPLIALAGGSVGKREKCAGLLTPDTTDQIMRDLIRR